jgi:hypothetical protein
MSWSFSRVGLTVLACALATGVSAADLPQPGVCMREGAKLAGMPPVQGGKGVRQPKKIHHVFPKYPDVPPTTVIKRGPWMGELLVDRQGLVMQVWTTREMVFNPPFPAFNRAIVDALRQSKFEPAVVQRERVPVCMTVTHIVDFS